MPWCPKCKTEYREGFTVCANCHVPLTEQCPEGEVPAEMETELSLMEPVVIYEAKDAAQAAMICEILHNADIATTMRDSEELGGLLRVYTGSTLYGMSVLVDRSQVEQAREVLQIWAEQDVNAPVSEDELTRQALSGLTEDELTRQAEAVPPQMIGSNAAYQKVKWAVIAVLAATALLLFWISR